MHYLSPWFSCAYCNSTSKLSLLGWISWNFFTGVCVCVCVCVCVHVHVESCVSTSLWPLDQARQAPLSKEFSWQEYWSELPFPSPRDLPDSGIKPTSLASPALAGSFFITEPLGKSFFTEVNLNSRIYLSKTFLCTYYVPNTGQLIKDTEMSKSFS